MPPRGAKPAEPSRVRLADPPKARSAEPSKVVKPRPVSRSNVRRAGPPPARPPQLADPRRRLRLGTVLAMVMLMTVAGRLTQLQLTSSAENAAKGLAIRLADVELPAPRGAILDRDGEFLAHSVEARYISVDPTLVKDPEKTTDQLFTVLREWGVTKSELLAKVSPHKRPDGEDAQFEYLARGVDAAVGEQIKAMELDGIGVVRDERRDVPNRDLAASVIGFTQADPSNNEERVGVAGIESEYESVLHGVKGRRIFEIGERNLAKEIPGGYSKVTPAKKGSSVELTIGRDLQYHVQSTLKQRGEVAKAFFGSAVVMDIRTGEVLAQASSPTYDAALPGEAPAGSMRDTSTQIVFDPGSVHKAIVIGAALEEGVIKPDSTVVVAPTITKGDTTYRDLEAFEAGTPLTIPGVLAYSSNVGTIKIADQLGKEKLYQYQRAFGLGSQTGEGLPNEASGQLLPPAEWSGSSPGSIPIGNGVAVTTLQMAAVYATIANDGLWVQPHLVRCTIDPKGKKVPAAAPATRRVMSAEHARQLRTALEAVTTLDNATGRSGAIEGYRIAGKTGSGRYPENGGYADGDVVSFIGMAPADAPRFVVAVVMHVPAGTGGAIAGPAFRDIMAFTLGHYKVPPTGVAPPALSAFP